MDSLKRAILDRLPRYYHVLREQSETGDKHAVSSAVLASLVGVDDTQVRKDLALIGVRGCPRVGYKVNEVVEAIRDILGFDQTHRAVIVGAGRLGGALASYPGFSAYGLEIVALFDNSPAKIGTMVGCQQVRPLDDLERIVKRSSVDIAVLTVPAGVAPELAVRLAHAGVQAIWNFAPTRFAVPEGVSVRHEQISGGLAELTHHLRCAIRDND